MRLVVAKADRRFSYRQLILIERFLKPVWLFVIGDAIASGQLTAVENWTKVAFTTPRRISAITADPYGAPAIPALAASAFDYKKVSRFFVVIR